MENAKTIRTVKKTSLCGFISFNMLYSGAKFGFQIGWNFRSERICYLCIKLLRLDGHQLNITKYNDTFINTCTNKKNIIIFHHYLLSHSRTVLLMTGYWGGFPGLKPIKLISVPTCGGQWALNGDGGSSLKYKNHDRGL
jgi:hypothetical protein